MQIERKLSSLRIFQSHLWEIKIPRITFQPIIENAYLHAFQGTINDGWIKIGGQKKREMDKSVLHICIMDNGMGMDEVKKEL